MEKLKVDLPPSYQARENKRTTAVFVTLARTTIPPGSLISACFAWKAIRVSAS